MIQLAQVESGNYNWGNLENGHNRKSANLSFEEPSVSLNQDRISEKCPLENKLGPFWTKPMFHIFQILLHFPNTSNAKLSLLIPANF